MTNAPAPDDPRSPPRPAAAPPLSPLEFNYFAAEEQLLQAGFRATRDRWLQPLVQVCRGCGVTAEYVSAAAFAMLLPVAVGLLGPATNWSAALVIGGLLLHVALDGLDGPLARAAGTDGPAGAFTDMCLDHVGFLVVIVLVAAVDLLDGFAACAYSSSYTVAIICTVLLNLLRRPLRFVVRTKYLFYVLLALQQSGGWNVLTPAALAFSCLHTVFAVAGFFAVRRALQ
jgi:phosphatidylglycerophosphate synthase